MRGSGGGKEGKKKVDIQCKCTQVHGTCIVAAWIGKKSCEAILNEAFEL